MGRWPGKCSPRRRRGQESRQAAGNYSPPPVLVCGGRQRLQASYKLTRYDKSEALRIGLPRLGPLWCIFWFSIGPLLIVGILLICWASGYPAAWPPHVPVPLHILKDLGVLLGCILTGLITTFVMLSWLTASQAVEITPHHLLTKTSLGSKPIGWRDVTGLLATDEYVCFCVNSPSAVVVPKAAFPSKEQAHAFAEQAELYWRRATGRKDPPPLDSAAVWPPAPRPMDAQEPEAGP